jgi:hypothetical protein
MIWKMENGNYLIRTMRSRYVDVINEAKGCFKSVHLNEFISSGLLDEASQFYEIKVNANFESSLREMDEIRDTGAYEDWIDYDRKIQSEVVQYRFGPIISSLEEYLYLANVYLIADSSLTEYLLEERVWGGFFGEIKLIKVICKNLQLIHDKPLPTEFFDAKLGDLNSKIS